MELVPGNVKYVWVMESLLNIISCHFGTADLVLPIFMHRFLPAHQPLPRAHGQNTLQPRPNGLPHEEMIFSLSKSLTLLYPCLHVPAGPKLIPTPSSDYFSRLSNHAMFVVAVVAFLGVGFGTSGLPYRASVPGDNCLLELVVLGVGG